ncbi:MAG: DinB family protein [Vicinamibacterales bacterium]
MSHADRIDGIVSRFEAAMDRFQARLESADAAAAERVPADGGWSLAQVAWHVAAVNRSFTSILDGSFAIAKPADTDFMERTWEEIGAGIPEKAQAPSRVQAPAGVKRDDVLTQLATSRERLIAAMRALDADRALLTIDAPLVGRISLYQVGEWAEVHVIRHNKQMKRLLA